MDHQLQALSINPNGYRLRLQTCGTPCLDDGRIIIEDFHDLPCCRHGGGWASRAVNGIDSWP
jgi:hypothetical protein